MRFQQPGCTLTILQHMKRYPVIFVVLSLAVLQSCTATRLVPAELHHRSYPVFNNNRHDSAILMMLSPYRDSLSKVMSKVIGFSNATLYEGKKENPLGNFFTDAMKEIAEKKFGRKIDAAIMNSGGIRSNVPKGNITVGTMYNLMPFDNLLVLQELKGTVLKQLLDHSANGGGWPVSGITMQVRNRKAENIVVQGKPFNENMTYVIAVSDYMANGGDYSKMLAGIPQHNVGYLLRDALIEYVQQFTSSGKPVTASAEKRISYVD